MGTPDTLFQSLVEDAHNDPYILALWLDGPHGKNQQTEYSDYDCTMVVEDNVLDEYKRKFERLGNPQMECKAMTLAEFKKDPEWDAAKAWHRYNYAYLEPPIDKTGTLQASTNPKARIHLCTA